MSDPALYPRFAQRKLQEALADTPVVLVHGPRQCGKTTLTRVFGSSHGYAYMSFDDGIIEASAKADPTGFVSELPKKVILDEIQRVPELFAAIKHAVDHDRTPGRFLLTGSSNVLMVPRLSDSLAGRMEILSLLPLSQGELSGTESRFIDQLFDGHFKVHAAARLGQDLAKRIASGGFPAALARSSAPRRTTWYREYLRALVERDIRDLARIASIEILPKLLALAATQTARLFNLSELTAPFQQSRPTIRDYVTLLSRVYLLEEIPPWHSNRLRRLVKTPKLHMGDTGVASALLGVDGAVLWRDRTLFGQLLETFVFNELARQASWQETQVRFHHFRDRDGAEVDLVLERGHDLCGVEVKAGATVTSADFRGMRQMKKAAGARFACGVVLYDGETTVPFGERMYAVPVRMLWELR
jgi:hypothetical protein